jgi:hypothetical protein
MDDAGISAGVFTPVFCLTEKLKHMNIHALRREYAQALYLYHAGADYDQHAAQRVNWALGHNRIDVVMRRYLR